VAHATLPGICLAFMCMVMMGSDGRFLPGLLIGSAVSAGLGLLAVDWITRQTRLTDDAAIAAVLSVSYGLGIVLLTIIQAMGTGQAAGLDSFLLGSTAGMLRSEAITLAIAAGLAAVMVLAFRRPMTIAAFDPVFASSTGINLRGTDLIMMGLALAITVIGLKIVGLILIVALLIIPAVTARFWTERVDHLVLIACGLGGLSGFLGAAISSIADKLPTGPIIVLVSFTLFALSLMLSPQRGLMAQLLQFRSFRHRVHLRQGLLALGRAEPVLEPLTVSILTREGLIRGDGAATEAGRAAAARALRDEARWAKARQIHADEAIMGRYDGLTPIETVLTADEIATIDQMLGPPKAMPT
jgi:manganese/zinc/iron transport system permease protein